MVRRLKRLCLGGEGAPTISNGRVHGLVASNALIKRAVLVVFRFFSECKAEIRWVTAKAQLDKMDGLAYLLADLLRGELLLEEANAIGKRAHKHVNTDVPKQEKELTDYAKEQRSYARTRVKRGKLDASILDQTLAEIDRKRDAAITALWRAEYEGLDLPAENTVVVESRARTEPEPEEVMDPIDVEAADLADLRAEIDVMEAKAQAALPVYEAAIAMFERALKIFKKVPVPTSDSGEKFDEKDGLIGLGLTRWLAGEEAKYDWGENFPTAVKERRQAQADRYFAAQEKAAWAMLEYRDAKRAVVETSAAVRKAWDEHDRRMKQNVHDSQVRALEAEAQLNRTRSEIARLTLLEATIPGESRAHTRERLHADAEKVWGAEWQSRSPTAVHQL